MNATVLSKWRARLLLVLALLSMLPFVGQAQFTYSTNDNQTITITSYNGSGGDVVIPSQVNGLPVTTIGGLAFDLQANVTNVTIPETVTDIQSQAFWDCHNLRAITIPSSVTNIGSGNFEFCTNMPAINVDPLNANYRSAEGILYNRDETTLIVCPRGKPGSVVIPSTVTNLELSAFAFCQKLTNVTLPESLTALSDWAFYYSGLCNLVIPPSVASIGSWSFAYCSGLSAATIPDGVTNIGERAFAFCTGLTNCTIPTAVINIGEDAFNYCSSLLAIEVHPLNADYTSAEGVLFNHDQTVLIQYPGGKAGDYTIPNSVTTIGEEAFWSSGRLSGVVIPASLNAIGSGAFYGCTALINVTIPNSVTSLGYYAFRYCTNLASVVLPERLFAMESGVFSGCSSLTNVSIPNSITYIGGYAFAGCTRLATVNIPAGVTFIAKGTFQYCGLTNVAIPNEVTEIGDYAFAGCPLTSVTIPDKVRMIGFEAFDECTNLTSVIIGKGVEYLGGYALADNPNLKSICFPGNAPTLEQGVFSGDYFATVCYLPGTTGWASYYGGLPTARWTLPNPNILTFPPYFGVQTDRFGFRVSWATNRTAVVEASTSLSSTNWVSLSTNRFGGLGNNGWFYFSDSEWTNYPNRIYRVRQQ